MIFKPDTERNPAKWLSSIYDSINVAEELSEQERGMIGDACVEGYEIDRDSRADWEAQNREAMKMALQVAKPKSHPFPGASNVIYPLITTAAIQFNARAIGAVVSNNKVVKPAVYGRDISGEKQARAERVAAFMNWQLLQEDETWEDDMDKLLVMLPITGVVFRKTYWSNLKRRITTEVVSPDNLIVNYFAKSLELAPRVTMMCPLRENEIYERKQSGEFLDVDFYMEPVQGKEDENRPQDDDNPETMFIEQETYFDLDGDGYREPYTVTVHLDSKKVARVAPRFDLAGVELQTPLKDPLPLEALVKMVEAMDGQWPSDLSRATVMRIVPLNHYTKYGFIPAPDGSFYDVGFGRLLVPLNAAVSTSINQMIDAGSLVNMGGGFLGKGIRVKKGDTGFTPGEFKVVDTGGQSLRENIYELKFQGPNMVSYQLMQSLVQAAQEISSVRDIMTGDIPNGDVPATTTMAAIEQAGKLFVGIYKRVHRSLKDELAKRYRLNSLYTSPDKYLGIVDDPKATPEDYRQGFTDIAPVSDPSMATDAQRMVKGQALMPFANDPLMDPVAIRKRVLESQEQPNPEELFAKQTPPPPPNVDLLKVQADLQVQMKMLEVQEKEVDAKIKKMATESVLNIAKAEAEEVGQQIEAYKRKWDALKISLDAELREKEIRLAGQKDNERGRGDVAKPQGDGQGPEPVGGPGEGSPYGPAPMGGIEDAGDDLGPGMGVGA